MAPVTGLHDAPTTGTDSSSSTTALELVTFVAARLTHDELVAIGLAVVCTLSVLLDQFSRPIMACLRASCLRELLLKIEVHAEMRAGQAAYEHALQYEHGARAQRANGGGGTGSGGNQRGAGSSAAATGGGTTEMSKYAHEMVLAESAAFSAKADDEAKAKPLEPDGAADARSRKYASVRGAARAARNKATLVYPGDGVYEGEYADGLKDGRGKFFYVSGSVYEGHWRADQKHGAGREVYPDGASYEGAFELGARHGVGTLRYANNDVYEGEWDQDLKEGFGTFRWAAGGVYEGEFSAGVMHGTGTYFFSDGCTYQGQYEDGKRHGRGIYRFLDGAIFEGEYNQGVVEGRGTFTFADGSTEVGRWEDGWPVGEATRFSPDHKHAWRLMDGHVTGPVSLDIADVIGRMAFKPKPWERAAQLARALREKLSAMEYEQVRDVAMATVYNTQRARPARLANGSPSKPPQPPGQKVFTTPVADRMGRLIKKSPASGASGGKSGKSSGKGGGCGSGGGGSGGGGSDAYKAHMARVHGRR